MNYRNGTNRHQAVPKNTIFVFGSNLQGIHGAGAALYALHFHNAILGKAEGLQGSSYAIPTRKKVGYKRFQTLTLEEIKKYVDNFLEFAKEHKELTFYVTPIGCGLAGWKYKDIAPFFASASENCILPPEFIF